MYGVPASACICTSDDWRNCDDNCDACWGQECHHALAAQSLLPETTRGAKGENPPAEIENL